MGIDATLERIVELLEKIAGASGSAAPAPAAAPRGRSAAKPKATPKSLDDLKVVLKKVLDDKKLGKDVAVAILQRFGASKLGDLDEAQYDEVYSYCEATLSGEVDPIGGSGGDELM